MNQEAKKTPEFYAVGLILRKRDRTLFGIEDADKILSLTEDIRKNNRGNSFILDNLGNKFGISLVHRNPQELYQQVTSLSYTIATSIILPPKNKQSETGARK